MSDTDPQLSPIAPIFACLFLWLPQGHTVPWLVQVEGAAWVSPRPLLLLQCCICRCLRDGFYVHQPSAHPVPPFPVSLIAARTCWPFFWQCLPILPPNPCHWQPPQRPYILPMITLPVFTYVSRWASFQWQPMVSALILQYHHFVIKFPWGKTIAHVISLLNLVYTRHFHIFSHRILTIDFWLKL